MKSEEMIFLLFLFMKFVFLNGLTTVPAKRSTATASINKCECVDISGLLNELGDIQYTLTDFTNHVSNLKEVPAISTKLNEMLTAVDNKTFQCANDSILLESQLNTSVKIDKSLEMINGSAMCACANRDKLQKDNKEIFAKLEQLGTISNTINEGVQICEKGTNEIKATLDIVINKFSRHDNNIESPQDLQIMKTMLEKITQQVTTFDDSKCRCADQFKVLYDKGCKGVDEFLEKLNKTGQQDNQCKKETTQEILIEMNKKLDTIIKTVGNGGTQDCGCLDKAQFEEEMPQYCGDRGKNKKQKRNKKDKNDKKDKKKKKEKGK
jgi:hypothetical protein